MCSYLYTANRDAKIKEFIPFFEADHIIAIEGYTVESIIKSRSTRSGQEKAYGSYRFRLTSGSYVMRKISCGEAIKLFEEYFGGYIIKERNLVDPLKAYESLKDVIGWSFKPYVLTPWHVWVLEKVPKGVKVRRFIISNNVIVMMP